MKPSLFPTGIPIEKVVALHLEQEYEMDQLRFTIRTDQIGNREIFLGIRERKSDLELLINPGGGARAIQTDSFPSELKKCAHLITQQAYQLLAEWALKERQNLTGIPYGPGQLVEEYLKAFPPEQRKKGAWLRQALGSTINSERISVCLTMLYQIPISTVLIFPKSCQKVPSNKYLNQNWIIGEGKLGTNRPNSDAILISLQLQDPSTPEYYLPGGIEHEFLLMFFQYLFQTSYLKLSIHFEWSERDSFELNKSKLLSKDRLS